MARFERLLFSGNREWACSRAEGDVLEIAAGTARNLPFYPEGVRVTGVELSPEMAALGRKRAEDMGRQIDMRVGDAEALDFPDESFDTVVCTYGLCTIPDDAAAVREAKRVLRPGGTDPARRACAQPEPGGEDDPAGARASGSPLRRRSPPARAARPPGREGFRVEEVKRSKAGWVELVSATKPA